MICGAWGGDAVSGGSEWVGGDGELGMAGLLERWEKQASNQAKGARDDGVFPPADGDGEERHVPGAALLLGCDGGLQGQAHAVALVGQLHVQPALRAQAAQPHLALHRVRLPALLHHAHQLRRLVRLGSCGEGTGAVR